MDCTYPKILGNLNNYKVCQNCNRINYYENEVCFDCGSDKFIDDKLLIVKLVDSSYDFYKLEGYTEEEIDNMLIEVK